MTNKMVKDKKLGQMDHIIKVIISKGKSMEKVDFNGLIIAIMKGSLKIIIWKDMVIINGQMVDFIKENGKITS